MLGVFDSGVGGLTVVRALAARFPALDIQFLGDHANMPYGDRPAEAVVDLTRAGVERLFDRGCRLVLLGCNTATAIAARRLQTNWLPTSGWPGHNVLGIVAPTVEAATQTPWAVTQPQYPQKNNTDTVVVFGTTRTISSGVYRQEILKRCPKVRVIERACPGLAERIEHRRPIPELALLVEAAVAAAIAESGVPPHRAILGCTHYPLVEHLFKRYLPAATRVLSQPEIVADSLDDYLARRPQYLSEHPSVSKRRIAVLTTGDVANADAAAAVFWSDAPRFARI